MLEEGVWGAVARGGGVQTNASEAYGKKSGGMEEQTEKANTANSTRFGPNKSLKFVAAGFAWCLVCGRDARVPKGCSIARTVEQVHQVRVSARVRVRARMHARARLCASVASTQVSVRARRHERSRVAQAWGPCVCGKGERWRCACKTAHEYLCEKARSCHASACACTCACASA
eukprot:1232647-Pleurochrysis_carterae.AAC.1